MDLLSAFYNYSPAAPENQSGVSSRRAFPFDLKSAMISETPIIT
jgi:hypothetical protein